MNVTVLTVRRISICLVRCEIPPGDWYETNEEVWLRGERQIGGYGSKIPDHGSTPAVYSASRGTRRVRGNGWPILDRQRGYTRQLTGAVPRLRPERFRA